MGNTFTNLLYFAKARGMFCLTMLLCASYRADGELSPDEQSRQLGFKSSGTIQRHARVYRLSCQKPNLFASRAG